jgi:alkylated DNA nucleotide flippase Atl1
MDLKAEKLTGKHIITYNFNDAESVYIIFDQLKSHRDGRFNARVKAIRQLPDKEVNLYQGSLNLMAGRSRSQIAKTLKERMPKDDLDFERFVEEACRIVVEAEEDTQEAEQLLLDESEATEPAYLVWPCILERLPVIWYGPGASGKTYFAMYFSLLVQNGLSFMGRSIEKRNVLFLDYEVDKKEALRRFGFIARHLKEISGKDIALPFYRKCLLPLSDDVSEIAIEMEKNEIGLVVIDSAGMATGGDIIKPETAIAFFNALRKVCDSSEAASVILTHVTKSERRQDGQKRLPIGNVYFENLSRIAWELRTQEADENDLAVGFFNRKTNFDKKNPKFGLKMVFNGSIAKVEAISAEDIESEEKTTEKMILDRLKEGPMKIKDIAEELDIVSGTVRVNLSRAKKRGKVTSLERGLWGLAAKDEEPPPGQWWDK